MLAFISFHLSDSNDLVSKCLGAAVLLFYIALILLFARILRRNEKDLGLEEKKQKFGELYHGLTTLNAINILSEKPLTWLYSPLFLGRRCLFAIITVYFIKSPNMQIIMHLVLSLAYVACFLL